MGFSHHPKGGFSRILWTHQNPMLEPCSPSNWADSHYWARHPTPLGSCFQWPDDPIEAGESSWLKRRRVKKKHTNSPWERKIACNKKNKSSKLCFKLSNHLWHSKKDHPKRTCSADMNFITWNLSQDLVFWEMSEILKPLPIDMVWFTRFTCSKKMAGPNPLSISTWIPKGRCIKKFWHQKLKWNAVESRPLDLKWKSPWTLNTQLLVFAISLYMGVSPSADHFW